MPERLPCEFFLIRYVPDVVKGEFVNIGVLLREAAGPAAKGVPAGRAQVRFTRDWSRVRCLDADADLPLLEGLEGEIAERLRSGTNPRDPKPVVEMLEDTLSNSLQITEARPVLAENLATEMEQLLRLYVEPIKVARTRVKSGRASIQATMRTDFERAGVWGLMRKRISAAMYTRPGDPLRIDCGYRAGGEAENVVKMFQAVSLESDVESAKVLAYSVPQIREGVRRVESAALELTAVVEPLRALGSPEEDESSEAVERYRFGVEAMERQQIRVITLNDLARAATTAQRELGL